MRPYLGLAVSLFLLLSLNCAVAQTSVPPLVNFQGRLASPNGDPIPDGTYSVRFSLWDDASAGTEQWNQTISTVQVKNGTFAVLLNTSAAGLFNGNRWLEIKIGSDPALSPRQQIVTVPYAFKSDLALTVPDNSISNSKLAGGITADKFASGIFNPVAWLLNGNSSVTSGFLGTTDNNPLILKVNNRRALRFAYSENTAGQYRSINVLGGSEINSIPAGVTGATIAGGGQDNFTGTDQLNSVTADFGTIGGGSDNTVSAPNATIAGGLSNLASGYWSSVGGGSSNTANSTWATVAGGVNNRASGSRSAVGGGDSNQTGGDYSTVAGGAFNIASGLYSFAAGEQARALHDGSFVWNDASNTTLGNPFSSTGANQFLIRATGGVGINTNNPNGYALNVNGTSNINGTLAVSGGVNSTGVSIGVQGTASSTGTGSIYGIYGTASGNNTSNYGVFGSASNYGVYGNGGSYGVYGSGSTGMYGYGTSSGVYGTHSNGNRGILGGSSYGVYGDAPAGGYAGSFNGNIKVVNTVYTSDRRFKQNIATFDNALDTILGLRGVSYEWKPTQGKHFPGGRQIGFIAQEVEQILPELVDTDQEGYKAVAYASVVPILVEAVKTLNARTVIQQKQFEALQRDNAAKQKENAELRATLTDVLRRLNALETNKR